jgi:hypothetical protein
MNPGGWNGFTTLSDFYDKFEAVDERRGIFYAYPGSLPNPGRRINVGFLVGQQYDLTTDAPLKDRKNNPLSFTREVKLRETGDNLEITGIRVIKYPYDYGTSGDQKNNDFAIFRLADVMLMKAEALLRTGRAAEALVLVNTIRVRRKATPMVSVNLDQLLDERGREMYWEGWRRNDLIRFGKFLQPWQEKAQSNPRNLLFPIPSDQLAVIQTLHRIQDINPFIFTSQKRSFYNDLFCFSPLRYYMKRCYFFIFICLVSCKQQPAGKPLFEKIRNSGIAFKNEVVNSADFNIFSYRNFYNGGGVAVADINNDGLSDVFFTANMGANKLFLNKGNFLFDDISEKAGFVQKEDWSTGVTMVDINADGWLDIYVCNAGYINGNAPRSQLFINNKNLTFTEAAERYGLTNTGGYATHAAFFDYDLDGDLDAFIINNSFIPVNTLNYANKRNLQAKDWPVADFLKGGGERFLRNDGGKFTDITQQAGVHGSLISFGLGVTVG